MASAQVPVGIRTRKIPQLTLESDHLAHNEQQQQQEGDASRKVEIRTKKRRRATRVRTSCEPCRDRKVRCDRKRPCSQCTLHHDDCYYEDAQPLSDIGEVEDEDELTIANAEIERLGQLVQSLNAQSGRSTTRQRSSPLPSTAQRFRDVATPPRPSVFRRSPLGDAPPHSSRERLPLPYTIRRRHLNQSIYLSTSIRSSLISYGYQSPIERFGRGQGGSPSKLEGAESFIRTGSGGS